MSREILRDRENAFEYEFFHKIDQQLIHQLRERLQSEERIESLSRCTGLTDKGTLGIHRISKAEETVIAELESVFEGESVP